jgi:hypothetical protein
MVRAKWDGVMCVVFIVCVCVCVCACCERGGEQWVYRRGCVERHGVIDAFMCACMCRAHTRYTPSSRHTASTQCSTTTTALSCMGGTRWSGTWRIHARRLLTTPARMALLSRPPSCSPLHSRGRRMGGQPASELVPAPGFLTLRSSDTR